MGMTIHYSLLYKGQSLPKVKQLLQALYTRARQLPFEEVREIEEHVGPDTDPKVYRKTTWIFDPQDDSRSYRVMSEREITFLTNPGPGCESACFGFAKYPAVITVGDKRDRKIRTKLAHWRWHDFCKTCYAAGEHHGGGPINFMRCHLCVVAMLDYAQELGILADVHDECDYWQERDVNLLYAYAGETTPELIAQVDGLLQLYPLLRDTMNKPALPKQEEVQEATTDGETANSR